MVDIFVFGYGRGEPEFTGVPSTIRQYFAFSVCADQVNVIAVDSQINSGTGEPRRPRIFLVAAPSQAEEVVERLRLARVDFVALKPEAFSVFGG